MAQTKEEIKIPVTNYFNINKIKPNDCGKKDGLNEGKS